MHRLKRTFKDEEIQSGILADLMIEEDFDFKETVSSSIHKLKSIPFKTLFSHKPEFVSKFVFNYL